MKNKIGLSLAVAMMVFTASGAFAAPCELNMPPEGMMNKPPGCEMSGPPPHPFNMSPECMEKMKKEHEKRRAEFDKKLNLTDAQKAAVEKNRMEDRAKMKPIYEEMKAKRLKMQEVCNSALSQDEKNKQINELKAQIHDLKVKSHAFREENMKKFEEILTPVQKKEFDKMKKEHKRKMDKKFKHHKDMMIPPACKN